VALKFIQNYFWEAFEMDVAGWGRVTLGYFNAFKEIEILSVE